MSGREASYTAPAIPANEEDRLEELRALRLLDTASEQRFDRYTSLIADLFDFPVVLVTLVDRDRQWFKSACGLDLCQTSRDVSFCAHAINHRGVMVVPDAREDARFAGNPLVTGHPYIRFYAGAIVHGPSGQPLGTLCVIDHQPRDFDERQCRRLRQFADLVEEEIAHSHDLERLRSAVEFSAYRDPLTHLPNRRLLTDRLDRLIALAESQDLQVAVLLFNIVGLRLINQSFGSEVGDELLRQMGERLLRHCPPGGTVARLQADELILTCCPVPDAGADSIDVVVERVRTALAKPYLVGGREHYLDLRIGGSIFPEHGSTPAVLIEKASAAIRFVGEGESARIRYFSKEESFSVSQRLRIESRLHRALDTEAFRLVYQPIASLHDGELASVEALLRWRDSELGRVPPDRFIPVAEQTKLIIPLGRWVQDAVCRQLAQWGERGSWDIPVAINVAPPELLQPDFARALIDRMESAGLAASLICVEITELSLVSDSRVVAQNLGLLNEASVRVHLDDFGTGYSSLAYLHRMPISTLKIDRSFVAGLPKGRNEAALTRTIVSMADSLGLDTVGEGVEKKDQLEFLGRIGCRYAQGYLIAKPMAASRVPPLLRRSLT